MKKQLRKPENWQDFEALGKKLYGELWGIPLKVKRNGRQGQRQNGVDLYGVPQGETEYWGVQFKGKDEYVDGKLSKAEIDKEIEAAQGFAPNLGVFIFATTANKDAVIEEYIRLKDVESRANGSFQILLDCWEDIVDHIEDCPNTKKFYAGELDMADSIEKRTNLEYKPLLVTLEGKGMNSKIDLKLQNEGRMVIVESITFSGDNVMKPQREQFPIQLLTGTHKWISFTVNDRKLINKSPYLVEITCSNELGQRFLVSGEHLGYRGLLDSVVMIN